MTPDWAAKPTTVPYASFGDPQSLNLYAFVENTPVNRADADGHASDAGFLQRPFESFGGSVYASAQAAVGLNDATFEVFLRNGDVLLMLAAQVQALAQKPLTAKQIQKMFYKQHGKAFNAAVRKVFHRDVPTQTLANAPKLDITKTLADLHKMGRGEDAESRNRVDYTDPKSPSLAQNGTIFIPQEAVASGNINRISGDYAHELANLLDFQINGYSGPIGTEQNYVTDQIKHDYPNDADTGMTVEVEMFGKPQF